MLEHGALRLPGASALPSINWGKNEVVLFPQDQHTLVLFLILEEMYSFSLSCLHMMLAKDFSWMVFIRLGKIPSNPSSLSDFYHDRALSFIKCFFL